MKSMIKSKLGQEMLDCRQLVIDMINPKFNESNTDYSPEFTLKNTAWILEKVRASDTYAQNLYAALCNNQFIKSEVISILKGCTWRCSWRYASEIIADMKAEGSYFKWYLGNDFQYYDGGIAEGTITEEIRSDLKKIGWIIVVDPSLKD